MKTDFFISYSGADLLWAEWIATQLHGAGYTTVYQEQDFHAGGNFILEMHRAAKESLRTIAVLSQRYLDACFTNPEWAAAFACDPEGNERRFIPVRIEDFKPDGLFTAITYIDLVGLSEAEATSRLLAKMAASIQVAVQQKARTAFPGSASPPVIKGTRYPGTLPPVCNLPRRNANFTGRVSFLESLRTSLKSGDKTAITQQAIYGLGGIGKTQLVLEYAWRSIAAYDLVWWIRSEDLSTLAFDYAAIATKLNLPEKDEQDQVVTVQAVKEWLEHNPGWLLIFDNARDSESILNYLPVAPTGHALITSRNQNWNNNLCTSLRVEVWSREESIFFLNKRTGLSDTAEVGNLAEKLGDLPLALEQAAAYCCKRQKSYGEYLELFIKRRSELWKRDRDAYHTTVAKTWSLAIDEIQKVSLAWDVLNLCTLVAPDDIPRTLIIKALDFYTGKDGKAAAVDPLDYDDAIEALSSYSLVSTDPKCISIHRLVQVVAGDRMQENKRIRYWKALVRAINFLFPEKARNNPSCWQNCAVLLPHAETVMTAVGNYKAIWKESALVLNKMGLYLQGRAYYSEAEPLFRRAKNIYKEKFGYNHVIVATSLNTLAELLREQEKYSDAEPLLRQALEIKEKTYGKEHPSVATSLNTLGLLLHAQEKSIEGESFCRRALAIYEKKLGCDHSSVATSLRNIASLLYTQKKYAEAELLCRRALVIYTHNLGESHHFVATTMTILSLLLCAQKKNIEAEEQCRMAQEIFREVLGREHPKTISCKQTLDTILGNNKHRST